MEKTVVGASIAGTKIGGAVDDAVLLVPDPMGATGTSVLNTLDLYERHVTGKPKRRIIIHLIAAPESLQRIRARYADVEIFTVRLDRGLSSEKVLAALPGTYWQDEKGLNEHQYIVPGAGGVGELMNNSFV
jgi:uracil phosphoribosyltransferase